MSKLKDMFHYGNFKKRVVIVFIEHIIAVITWIVIDQYFTYSLFDNAIEKENLQLVIFLAILMIIKLIVSIIEAIVRCILRHHLQRDYSNYARKDIFSKIINSNVKYFDKSNTGELFELIMNDSNNFSTFFSQDGLVSTENLLRVLTYLVILAFINIKLTLFVSICYFIGYAAIIISNKRTLHLAKEIRELNISITKSITEQINGLELIKSLRIEEYKLEKMNSLINDFTKTSLKLDKKIRKYNFIYDIFSLLVIVIITYFGGINIVNGILTYGSLMIFINSVTSINKYCDVFIRHIQKLNNAYVSFIKILKFNKEYEIEDDNGTLQLSKINSIELKNISFSYNDEKQILKNINLEVGEQEKVAIIGRTGSGKTTLVNLLCRFYNLQDGEIKINGKDYKQYRMKDLREQIGYVMQDVVIFEGDVYENINYANKDVSKEEIINICKRLNLHNKIISFEDGYKTNLNKNKDLLSTRRKTNDKFCKNTCRKSKHDNSG